MIIKQVLKPIDRDFEHYGVYTFTVLCLTA